MNSARRLPMSLDPSYLPYYLLRTTLRMFIAMGASVVFSCVFAALTTKYRIAEKVMVPMLDILQSIPILGFLSITVTAFIALFPGNLLGVECAAIFAIFTSQAWNMAFSAYQGFRTVPAELSEAAQVFQLSGWQRFWRLELPFAMPGLLWNMMMSMSGGWFFVVASEAIMVSNQTIKLPGMGSYIALAIEQSDLGAIGWAIFAMLIAVLLYDQLFFRPLLAWADKFRFEETGGDTAQSSWLLTWLRRTERTQQIVEWFGTSWSARSPCSACRTTAPRSARAGPAVAGAAARVGCGDRRRGVLRAVEPGPLHPHRSRLERSRARGGAGRVHHAARGAAAGAGRAGLGAGRDLDRHEPALGFAHAGGGAVPGGLPGQPGVPGGGHHHRALPPEPDIWLSPLMILGTQWYLLFNVIAGASTIPTELRHAARTSASPAG
jgi:NitT/TauT family transport system permease protein